MRLLHVFTIVVFAGALLSASRAPTVRPALLDKTELGQRFLLQVSHEQQDGRPDFKTSRSRVVTFERQGEALQMLDVSDSRATAQPLAKIPIRHETATTLELDLNDGFDRVYSEEDRTGEDYYGRVEAHEGHWIQLGERKALSVSNHGPMLVFDQEARTEDGERVVVHYYLSRYRPDPDFQPFEMQNLKHFGFYETYPRWRMGRWVLYAMKFDPREPIVFALSSAIPERHRAAAREGALYWNRAFGKPLLRVIDAPAGVHAPNPDYNVIEWATSGDYASTSYIQSDPFTGQILHAHIFVLPEFMMEGSLDEQNDHLRYIVAHEVGHALGLRHNFAPGAVVTVMDYFRLTQILKIGADIRQGKAALPYDSDVVRHVYLDEPLDLAALPPFCTDSQRGCMPYQSPPPESEGVRGDSPSDPQDRER